MEREQKQNKAINSDPILIIKVEGWGDGMWMREMLISDVQGIEGLWKDRESSQPRFQDFQLLAVIRK